MNQLQAFRATLALARRHGMDDLDGDVKEIQYAHLQSMLDRIEAAPETFSPAKLGRWLGWAQACVVAAYIGVTLEDVKQLNLSFSEPSHD